MVRVRYTNCKFLVNNQPKSRKSEINQNLLKLIFNLRLNFYNEYFLFHWHTLIFKDYHFVGATYLIFNSMGVVAPMLPTLTRTLYIGQMEMPVGKSRSITQTLQAYPQVHQKSRNTKGVFFSESAVCLSNLQTKYS